MVILRMDDDRPDSREPGCLGGAQDRVLEQPLADPSSGMATIDGQPGKEHDREGMTADALGYTRRYRCMIHGAHGQAVEADQDLPVAHDESAGRFRPLTGKGVPSEPFIENRGTAVEAIRPMGGGQLLGRRDHLSQGALCCISFLRPGLTLAGRSSIALNASHCA